jgi:hypothetical protein
MSPINTLNVCPLIGAEHTTILLPTLRFPLIPAPPDITREPVKEFVESTPHIIARLPLIDVPPEIKRPPAIEAPDDITDPPLKYNPFETDIPPATFNFAKIVLSVYEMIPP